MRVCVAALLLAALAVPPTWANDRKTQPFDSLNVDLGRVRGKPVGVMSAG